MSIAISKEGENIPAAAGYSHPPKASYDVAPLSAHILASIEMNVP